MSDDLVEIKAEEGRINKAADSSISSPIQTKKASMPNSPGHTMPQFSSWKPPVQKSKTIRLLKAEKQRRHLYSQPIVETIWSEFSVELSASAGGGLPNLQYRRTSNSQGRPRSTLLRPKTTISSAMIADILPLEEPSSFPTCYDSILSSM
jgi:hypothetical protein